MKKKEVEEVLDRIQEYALEEIMGDRFGSYSKYIIQDRAIPDVRDGLKPVQRRILYGMYKDKNTYEKGYRKSAKTVGNVMGNYHPHGDSSIYEAMVRMSQWWKQNTPYIDMHGNNGSMDGDSAAAMRYTEARLSKISNELLKDLDKETVKWAPNFDDTELEPTVLPVRFPNLLVNGAMGISAGYATNIPPHNLGEVIDATVKRIDSPNCTLDTIMNIIKGPDFPTGGIACGISEIRKAFETGKGKVIVKSRCSFQEEKNKTILAVTEIPFDVNKALLVRKIDEIRIDKKIDGIIEVRDESDKDGLRIAIDIKKDANKELILNYLLKNTELQITYSYNMVVIDNKRPKLLGIIPILDSYISFQKEFITKRTTFDLNHALARLHIVEGLIKCISILDEVIKIIRASKNKSDARDNLMKEYEFTYEQAEAIITLQLYRLSNTDVTLLEEELEKLNIVIKGLRAILDDEENLKKVMKDELKKIKKEYAHDRLTTIQDEIVDIKIDEADMITKEDVVVMITKDGYIKRSSMRSYSSTNDEVTLKDNDYIIGKYEMSTLDTLLVFTSLGNYLYVPVHTIFDIKWKDMGKHISNLVKLEEKEEIISCVPVNDFTKNITIVLASKLGMVKRSLLSDFKVSRYSKPINCFKIKDDDEVVSAQVVTGNDIFMSTRNGYGLWFNKDEIPVAGLRTSGVKGINLKDDEVVSLSSFDKDTDNYILIIMDKGNAKRVKIDEFDKMSRARRGLLLLREVKTNPYKIVKTFIPKHGDTFGIKTPDVSIFKVTDAPIMDRYSTGSSISKHQIFDAFISSSLIEKDELLNIDDEKIQTEEVKKTVSLKEIDERLMTIDDFLD